MLGSLRLPAILLVSASPAAAAGTNIAVSAAVAFAGGVAHIRAGRVDWRAVLWMTPPSVAGAFVGAYLGHLLPARWLLAAIAAVLLYSGLDLLLGLRWSRSEARRPRTIAAVSGLLIGLLGGAVGLVLGTLRLPALLNGVGLTPHAAVGTNLVVGFFLGVSGFLGHLSRFQVEWLVLAVSLVASAPGAWFGARATGRLSERALRKAIAVALLAVSVAIAAAAAR